MTSKQILVLLCVGVVCLLPRPVVSHGRLWEPPGRSTMWRRGFSTPINYNDDELFCGGFTHQVNLGGKCGVCGDAYDHRDPKPNEAGGRYATGTIARTYTQGQRTSFTVELTTSHQGWFEFKICPTNNYKVKATQDCMDLHPVPLADGSGTRYKDTRQEGWSGYLNVPVKLPDDLTCDFCVLQWRYHTGNTWGHDKNGHACTGCGPQEEFYGCSDIRILPKSSSQLSATHRPIHQQPITQRPATQRPVTQKPTTQQLTQGNCHPVGVYAQMAQYSTWCNDNCSRGYCPDNMCKCS